MPFGNTMNANRRQSEAWTNLLRFSRAREFRAPVVVDYDIPEVGPNNTPLQDTNGDPVYSKVYILRHYWREENVVQLSISDTCIRDARGNSTLFRPIAVYLEEEKGNRGQKPSLISVCVVDFDNWRYEVGEDGTAQGATPGGRVETLLRQLRDAAMDYNHSSGRP